MNQLFALATDLDGTLIPLGGDAQQVSALRTIEGMLRDHRMKLLFVTGRSAKLTIDAMEESALPEPNAILCDVGSCLMTRAVDGASFTRCDEYHAEVRGKLGHWTNDAISKALLESGMPLRRQEDELQTEVKCSFYFDAEDFQLVKSRTERWIIDQSIALQMVISVDPFNGRGLLDLMPDGVNKAFGLNWWRQSEKLSLDQIVFSGDSGNDAAAMTSGVRSIVVANAAESLIAESKAFHGDSERLFLAQRPATLGVLDGLRHFLLR